MQSDPKTCCHLYKRIYVSPGGLCESYSNPLRGRIKHCYPQVPARTHTRGRTHSCANRGGVCPGTSLWYQMVLHRGSCTEALDVPVSVFRLTGPDLIAHFHCQVIQQAAATSHFHVHPVENLPAVNPQGDPEPSGPDCTAERTQGCVHSHVTLKHYQGRCHWRLSHSCAEI